MNIEADITKYIFYTIYQDYKEFGSQHIEYGVERYNGREHWDYFYPFMNIDEFCPWPDEVRAGSWEEVARKIADFGDVMIVNSAVEIKNIEDMLFLIFLPSHPTEYQVKSLEAKLESLNLSKFNVIVCGEYAKIFEEEKALIPHEEREAWYRDYLEKYIQENKEKQL